MKKLICLLVITLSCCNPVFAEKIERIPAEKKTIVVDKKPMKHKDKMEVRKELQSSRKRCYNAYDKRKNKSYVICEGGK